jgi:hypothetical protein
MAQPYKPELFSIDSVLNFYQLSDGVHYKIYGGTSPKAEYCRYYFDGDEKEIGFQRLDEELQSLKNNIDNTNPYLIQIFKKQGRKKIAAIEDQPTTQIVFQLNKPERYVPYGGMGMMPQQSDPDLKMILSKIVEGQNLLISKLSAEEVEEDIEENPEGGFLGAVLNNEQFQQMAIATITGILTNKFMLNTPTALAGIPNEDQQTKALQAIELLSNKDAHYGDHLLYLANLDDQKFKFLLSFIK